MEKKEIILIAIYSMIIIISLVFSYLLINNNKNKLNYEEKNIYESILLEKNNFKNPESIKILSVKYCNEDYSIIWLTADNSYGASTTDIYFKNKNVITNFSYVAKVVSDECFKIELENYDSVKKLSKESIAKINNRLAEAK